MTPFLNFYLSYLLMFRSEGTHKNKFGPMFPTGKSFEITVIDIMRFETGKLIEHWGVPDKLALMEQLGMKPPPKLIMKVMSLLNRRK